MREACIKCGRESIATLNIEATIGTTLLKVSGERQQPAVCAHCMLELTKWISTTNDDHDLHLRSMPAARHGRPCASRAGDRHVGRPSDRPGDGEADA